jgi:hypothetical protein
MGCAHASGFLGLLLLAVINGLKATPGQVIQIGRSFCCRWLARSLEKRFLSGRLAFKARWHWRFQGPRGLGELDRLCLLG